MNLLGVGLSGRSSIGTYCFFWCKHSSNWLTALFSCLWATTVSVRSFKGALWCVLYTSNLSEFTKEA